jgi:cell wall-associated NlpC family hydrolase
MSAINLRTHIATFLIAFVVAACTSVPRQRTDAAPDPGLTNEGQQLVRVAAELIGTPYKYGGEDPRRGFDCSGLVFYSFDRLGLEVPRTAAEQREAARPVELDSLSPGDLVFFRTTTRRVDHVGIYAGDGKFIHAPRTGHVVSYAYLEDPYYRRHFVSAGRLR